MTFEVVPVEKIYCLAAAEVERVTEKWDGVVFDLSKTGGLDKAVEARRELANVRTAIEKTRVEVKAPYLDAGRAIDDYAKKLTGPVLLVEKSIGAQIQQHKDEIAKLDELKRKDAERAQAAIQKRITDIRDIPIKLQTAKANEVASTIVALQALSIDGTYGDFIKQAEEEKARTLEILGMMLDLKKVAEASAQQVASRTTEVAQAEQPIPTETEKPKPTPKKPTRDDIVALVANTYAVPKSQALAWLSGMEFKEAGKK